MGTDVVRLINGERLVVLGWGRGILMQIAHPLVAAGVAEHSTFRRTPWSRYMRLHATIRAMRALTFGTPPHAAVATARINAIHDRVHGTLRDRVGPFAAGTPYSAHDPALLLWVHATLLDSLPATYELLVAPLPQGAHDQYCAEAAGTAVPLGFERTQVPRDATSLARYVTSMLEGRQLTISDAARELARDVLYPPFGWAAGPIGTLHRGFAIGRLPGVLRDRYGFTWTAADEHRFVRLAALTRRLRARVPSRVARFSG